MKILTSTKQNQILNNIIYILALVVLEIENKSKRTDAIRCLYDILKTTNNTFDKARFFDSYDRWKKLKEKRDKEKINDANNI